MNYDDFYLLGLIKDLDNKIIYILSILSRASEASVTVGSLLQSGLNDPNLDGKLPVSSAVGGFYVQKASDGTPITLFFWLPGDTRWR